MPRESRIDFARNEAMASYLAALEPIYQKLAGADKAISDKIAFFEALSKEKLIDLEQPEIKLLLTILDFKRKARFATSERTNEITKMGLQMPKSKREIKVD